MARTALGNELTRNHRRTQQQIATVVLRRLLELWPALDPTRLDETSPAFISAVMELVRGGHALSSRAAVSYYAAYRLAEGIAGAPPPVPTPALDLAAVRTSLLVTGPVSIKSATGNGMTIQKATANALVKVSGAVTRHVETGGRDVVIESVNRDQQALGWARVASGGGCAFCLMLAGRGPVYKNEGTAAFDAHDHCNCGAEPAFEGYEWNETSRAAREAYEAATARDGDFYQQWSDAYTGPVPQDAKARSTLLVNGPFRQYLAANPL